MQHLENRHADSAFTVCNGRFLGALLPCCRLTRQAGEEEPRGVRDAWRCWPLSGVAGCLRRTFAMLGLRGVGKTLFGILAIKNLALKLFKWSTHGATTTYLQAQRPNAGLSRILNQSSVIRVPDIFARYSKAFLPLLHLL